MRRPLGAMLGVLIGIWIRSLRVSVDSDVDLGAPRRRVFAFFHGQQMALLGVPMSRTAAIMVSHSRDGELQTGVMRALGLTVVRGSGSRGGARALSKLVKLLRRDRAAGFAVDGPRGPAGVAKNGAACAAVVSDAELVPVASAARRAIVLRRAWDQFEIPLPFSRVAIVIGRPLRGADVRERPDVLAAAIAGARARAERMVSRVPRSDRSRLPR